MPARDGVRLAVTEAGSGPPIVFVHEFGGDSTSWDGQVAAFVDRYRCVTFNARGYPPSDVPEDVDAYSQWHARDDVLAVLDGLGIVRTALVGLSMGAFSSLHVALAAPERVAAIVIAGIGYGAPPAGRERFQAEMRANAEAIERDGIAAFAETYGRTPARALLARKDPTAYAAQHARLAAHSALGSANTMRGVQGRRPSLYDFEDSLRDLRVPTLIVGGEADEAALEATRMLAATIPGSRLELLPATGHLINLEEPARFDALVGSFLDEVGWR
ncbi:MAG TPA: alpha/beta hydrolase [Candidatus Limnocylindrales bacterium]|nr:alpha/beta hydrolase [Candidatus Limnocylindrales bacterium]